MCGRKKKFGLNMMATVDSTGRFLDVDIRHPASTSDFLVFETSDLKDKLEAHNFLAPGLVLFGDNAYPARKYMVTPFRNARGSQDHFNFYQSQLRIIVECAFGKFVHRWGVLRKALPARIGIKKITSLVMALCRLHNYCINCNDYEADKILAQDELNTTLESDIVLERTGDNHFSPTGLLHGGEHFADYGRYNLRMIRRMENEIENSAPRERLHKMVVDYGLTRPSSN